MADRDATGALTEFMSRIKGQESVDVMSTDSGVLASFEVSPGVRQLLVLRAEMENGKPVLRAELMYGAAQAEYDQARQSLGNARFHDGKMNKDGGLQGAAWNAPPAKSAGEGATDGDGGE